MKRKATILTTQELEIMKIVWELGQATVRDVYETLLKRRRIAYTTVMTMMKILEEKGHLRRRTQGRAYLYRPSRPKRQVVGAMVREFVDRVFNGSAEPLLVHLVEERYVSDEELEEVQRMMGEEEKEKEKEKEKGKEP